MKNELLTPAETAARIASGAVMSIAGPDALLAQLPRGNWIGGTTVYMLTEDGGARVEDRLFCSTFDSATRATLRHLPPEDLSRLAEGQHAGGVTLVLIPAFSQAHTRFALEGTTYPGLFDQPLMGWITGVPVEEIGRTPPATYDGRTGLRHTEGAVVLHIALPESATPAIDIVNIFTPGTDDLILGFSETGFSARTAIVDGKTVALADILAAHAVDTRLPLVANYAGAHINVSFESIDPATGEVNFYAPVVAGVEYRPARPVPDYAAAFAETLGQGGSGLLSCNCILNYLHGNMAGKRTGRFTGPVTFGEIAYILLNQTLVKLDLAA